MEHGVRCHCGSYELWDQFYYDADVEGTIAYETKVPIRSCAACGDNCVWEGTGVRTGRVFEGIEA